MLVLAGAAVAATALPAAAAATPAPAVQRAAVAPVERFVEAWECQYGRGVVVEDPTSPTDLSCEGGHFDGYWVLP